MYLTTGKVYEVIEYKYGNQTLKIINDIGVTDIFFWYFSTDPNFINITTEYNRNEVITEILK